MCYGCTGSTGSSTSSQKRCLNSLGGGHLWFNESLQCAGGIKIIIKKNLPSDMDKFVGTLPHTHGRTNNYEIIHKGPSLFNLTFNTNTLHLIFDSTQCFT